jgi:uncharacterized peroxidase-related enzyme
VRELPDDEREALVAALARDWRTAKLSDADAALCAFAEKLTRTPGAMAEEDLAALRAHDFDDRALHDATQVVAYFNYINRVADALHVDLESGMPPDPRA